MYTHRISVQNLWESKTSNHYFLTLREAQVCQFTFRQFLPDDCVQLHCANDLSLAI